jgi:hypothetical protein
MQLAGLLAFGFAVARVARQTRRQDVRQSGHDSLIRVQVDLDELDPDAVRVEWQR